LVAHACIADGEATAQAAEARFDGTVLSALQQTETALDAYLREMARNQELWQGAIARRTQPATRETCSGSVAPVFSLCSVSRQVSPSPSQQSRLPIQQSPTLK
jgi:hypothetical protein